jgi:hypothetical protein
MIMKNLTAISAIFATVLSASAFANEEVAQNLTDKKHTFGAQWSLGSADYERSHFSDDGVIQLYGYYNYAINKQVAIEVGINSGSDWGWDCDNDYDNDDWDCDTGWFDWDDDDIEYTNFVIAAKGSIPLSKRNSLFAKLGGQFYDYEINYRDNTDTDESGFGLFAEAGWQYRWDFGLGLNAGLQFIDMGNLDTSTFTAGVSYQF